MQNDAFKSCVTLPRLPQSLVLSWAALQCISPQGWAGTMVWLNVKLWLSPWQLMMASGLHSFPGLDGDHRVAHIAVDSSGTSASIILICFVYQAKAIHMSAIAAIGKLS